MNTELDRYKKALETAEWWINSCCEDGQRKNALREITMVLNPPPEYEEVTIERWAVIAPSGYVEATYAYEDGANLAVSEGKWQGYATAKLTGTLKRLKPQKVEKSVSGKVRWSKTEGIKFPITDDINFEKLVGKTGVLTFTWTE